MSLIRRNSTYALVSFFTHAPVGNRIDAYDATSLLTGGLLNSSLVEFTTSKQLGGAAAGTVQITLKGYQTTGPFAGQPWLSLLHNGDWWMIDIIKNGVPQGLSYGVIDRVGVKIHANAQGAGEVEIVVDGRDVAFALDDTPVYFNPFDSTMDNALGINMINILDTLAGKPSDVVVSMVRGMMGGSATAGLFGGHTKVPPGLGSLGGFWIDFVDLVNAVQTSLRGLVNASSAITPQGNSSVWAFVNSWRNPAMNELFMDVKPEAGLPKQALLVFREHPQVNSVDGLFSSWFGLRCWNVDVGSLRGIDLTKGDNRVNHVIATGDMAADGTHDPYGLYAPVADTESIELYGLHKLEESITYYHDVGAAGFATEVQDWLFLIVSWNVLNHDYLQGTITVAELRAEIRVGQRIALVGGAPAGYQGFPAGGIPNEVGVAVDPNAMTFYVESVQHTYTEGENPVCTTVLQVSHGYAEGARLGDIAERVAKFQVPVGTGGANEGEINVQTAAEDQQIDAGSSAGGLGPGDYEGGNL